MRITARPVGDRMVNALRLGSQLASDEGMLAHRIKVNGNSAITWGEENGDRKREGV
jgi:hypothetical protein